MFLICPGANKSDTESKQSFFHGKFPAYTLSYNFKKPRLERLIVTEKKAFDKQEGEDELSKYF